jgi:hypothetical protein
LVARAIELKSSDDWIKSSNELKTCSACGKKLGPCLRNNAIKFIRNLKKRAIFLSAAARNLEKADQEQEDNLK